MKKLLLLINPVTAQATLGPCLMDVIDCFIKGGYAVTVHITQRKGETQEIAASEGENFDTIVCVGGDGTLNDTVSGVMNLSKRPRIGYIPAGTTNDFATSWGISKNPIEAARNIVMSEPRKTDVSMFCGRPFVYVAAFGAFTEVSYQTPQPLKNSLGRSAYIFEGIKSLSTIRPWRMTVEYDGGSITGDFLYGMISNSKSVGGFELKMKDDISISDGLMELILVRQPEKHADNAKMLTAVLTQDVTSEYITFAHTKHVSFTSDIAIPWTVDGEFGGRVKNGDADIIGHAIELYL